MESDPVEAGRLQTLLRGDAGRVEVAGSLEQLLSRVEGGGIDLVLAGVPAGSDAAMVSLIRARAPRTKVVVRAARGTIQSAVEAMKGGASDYVTRPLGDDALREVVRRALAGRSDGADGLASVVGEIATVASPDDLIPSLKKALDVVLRAAHADVGEIFLCEPNQRDALLSVWSGQGGAALTERVRFPLGVGFPGLIAEAHRPVASRGPLDVDPRFLRRKVAAEGLRAFVGVPLRDPSAAFGSIHVFSRDESFPLDEVAHLLEAVAQPISTALRAGLASLQQSVDDLFSETRVDEPVLRRLFDVMWRTAGAQRGSLAVLEPDGVATRRVIVHGDPSEVCSCVSTGDFEGCPSIAGARGVFAPTSRRHWPARCKAGLPSDWSSPCCVPLSASGQLHGLIVLDLGRGARDEGNARLVPLLTMARRAAHWLHARPPARPEAEAPAPSKAPPAELEIVMLGPFALRLRGKPVSLDAFARTRSVALLKLLAAKEGAPIHREVLVEHLWPDVDVDAGLNRLHGIVHDLRAVLDEGRGARQESYVRLRGDSYLLDVSASVDLDVPRFRAAGTQGLALSGSGDPKARVLLERAAALYGGDFLEDEPFAEWCSGVRESLRDLARRVNVRLADLHRKEGAREQGLACLRRAAATDPLADDLVVGQMTLLVELGRTGEALRLYDTHVRALGDELGVGPSEALRAARTALLGRIDRGR